MQTHRLKTKSCYFKDIASDRKSFEVRKNDRYFKAGDILILIELSERKLDLNIQGRESEYETGAVKSARISYVLSHEQFPEGIELGYCVLGLIHIYDHTVNQAI